MGNQDKHETIYRSAIDGKIVSKTYADANPTTTIRQEVVWGIPRTFTLQRDEDVTGVSGVGTVAEGVQFSDGTVVIRWVVGEHQSTVIWPDLEGVLAIHGHDGKTRVVWN